MKKIAHLDHRIDTDILREELRASPDLWNQFTMRTRLYATPHAQVQDIWVRYNAWENFDPLNPARFNEPHESVWYPAYVRLRSLRRIIFDVMRITEGERLGGVLITRIPAGGVVEPHIDRGWHAGYYDKFAVQVAGGAEQTFNFDGEQLVTYPGDLYTFDNSHTHWVQNNSTIDRITLIICIRLSKPGRFLCLGE